MEKSLITDFEADYSNGDATTAAGVYDRIKKENLIVASESTFDEKFHSYRREGKNSGRATAMISFK